MDASVPQFEPEKAYNVLNECHSNSDLESVLSRPLLLQLDSLHWQLCKLLIPPPFSLLWGQLEQPDSLERVATRRSVQSDLVMPPSSTKSTVFFVGGGNMVTAIVGGLDRSKWRVVVDEIVESQRKKLEDELRVETVSSCDAKVIKVRFTSMSITFHS